VERLRDLGYLVEAVPAVWAVTSPLVVVAPSLLFNDDEAAAIVIGLRSAIEPMPSKLPPPTSKGPPRF
jgi:hypothetical protein